MPTANYYIAPSDGWVQIADSPKFVRVTGVPHSHPYYLASGSSAPSLTAPKGTGTVTFATGVPVADETVLIGSETFTFKATRTAAFEVAIGGSNTATATNFAAAVNSDSTLVTASVGTNVVTLSAYVTGTAGNYAISTAATNVSVSGANMTGGAAKVEGILVCHHPFKVNVTMAEKLYARVANPTPNSNQNDGKIRLDVFTIS